MSLENDGKIKKETRDQKAVRKMRENNYGLKIRFANKKNDYIKNIINGRYFLARCNMIAEQLLAKEIKEKIDGATKTEEYIRSEYALTKMQAIMSMRNAHFAKLDLMKDHGMTEKDILEIEEDYYNGKIIREDYDEGYKRRDKAEFVNTSTD